MKRKQITATGAAVRGIGTGVLLGLVMTLGVAALLTTLIVKGKVGDSAVGFCVILTHGGAAFTASLVGGKLSVNRCYLSCMISALLYCLTMMGCAVLMLDANLSGVWGYILTCVLGAVCGCVVCLLTTGKKIRKKVPYL